MKNKKIFLSVLCAFLLFVTGCSNDNNNLSKKENAIDSMVGLIEVRDAKFYLTPTIKELVEQLVNSSEIRIGGTNLRNGYNTNALKTDDRNFYEEKGRSGNMLLMVDKGNTTILKFNADSDNPDDLLVNYTTDDEFTILEGKVEILNKKLVIGETTKDEIIKILGDKAQCNSNSCYYKTEEYEWDTYRFHFKNDDILYSFSLYNY